MKDVLEISGNFKHKEKELIPKSAQKNENITYFKISDLSMLSKFSKLSDFKDLKNKPVKILKDYIQIKDELPSGVSIESLVESELNVAKSEPKSKSETKPKTKKS